ncbi:MAG: amidase [Rhodospirillales bacterium]|jgi:aspartyl-tRNA(Asn)/glutamyl-tRNA(Gln) amidotransferase subunit A|nr:amidase [Rhodospirillales bacterium]MDP6774120.1 amidase [Rhodospirillales bacterium]
MKTFQGLSSDLETGRVTSRTLVDECLARIADDAGEGRRTFLKVYVDEARAAAEAIDRARTLGMAPTPYAGIPVSIKDLYDVAGDVTTGGSKALRDASPAAADCPAVARLRAAGLVIVGRTNLTEFAFSAMGVNYHHGTPKNPWDRETGRIPGGSSSGAAVSVTDGMAFMGLGSDTGGSIRIPAALCGIAGFKPTQRRISRDGVLPLSTSLDSVGPLAPSVACCAVVDAILAGEPAAVREALPVAGLRLAVPQTQVLDDMDEAVAQAFEGALARLSRAGARIDEIPFAELAEIPEINAKGGLVVAEAYGWHRPLLEKAADLYDPWIRTRIERGAKQDAADYIELLNRRADMQARADRVTAPFDALIMPTVPLVAPAFAGIEDEKAFSRNNVMLLRNTLIFNFLDRCAVSLPCHEPGGAPVGLMVAGEHGEDRRLLAMALAIEEVVSR